MAAKKHKASIKLSGKAVHRVESVLRSGLSFASYSAHKAKGLSMSDVSYATGKKLGLQPSGDVRLDPRKVARFTEHLRAAMKRSGALNGENKAIGDKITRKIK
jgi:hypothetical protein